MWSQSFLPSMWSNLSVRRHHLDAWGSWCPLSALQRHLLLPLTSVTGPNSTRVFILMSVDKRVFVVVGGQFGSEGKGKVAAYLTERYGVRYCLRTGGPNAGHCFQTEGGTAFKLRQLPAGAVYPDTRLLIPAGAIIDLPILKAELDLLKLDHRRVGIDRNAMVISGEDTNAEHDMYEHIGSTQTGTGAATARRVMRGQGYSRVRLAKDYTELHPFLTEVTQELERAPSVVVEGTQGFGLSLYHTDFYPKCTSRDTSAAGVISEAGISPRRVTDIIMVVRTYPIRVAGEQAGPLFGEVSWEVIRIASGYRDSIEERTTVTNRIRRVGTFDQDQFMKAVQVNQPTMLVVNFLDYLDAEVRGIRSQDLLTIQPKFFCQGLERLSGVQVGLGGTGPKINDLVVF
jgi:adenylosuccinate synthase